jgi:hypothetical protein
MKLLILILLFSINSYSQDTLLLKVRDCDCGWAGFAPDTVIVKNGMVKYDFTNTDKKPIPVTLKRAMEIWDRNCSRILKPKNKKP